jgi:enamine deaminase RidA (YjgF/YER057c/UK114 family)
MRPLRIQSTTGQDQHYRAFVADTGEVALIAGVCGRAGEDGHPIDDIVGQARRAAELVRDLIQQANIKAQPQIVLRVLRSASAQYGASIDEVGDAIRAVFSSPEPSVNVTLVSRLMNEAAMLEIDAVLAAELPFGVS